MNLVIRCFTDLYRNYRNQVCIAILRLPYGYEEWFLTVGEEYKFQVLGKNIRKVFGP